MSQKEDKMGSFRWLHFSDLHFNQQEGYNECDARIDLFEYLEQKNCLVIIFL